MHGKSCAFEHQSIGFNKLTIKHMKKEKCGERKGMESCDQIQAIAGRKPAVFLVTAYGERMRKLCYTNLAIVQLLLVRIAVLCLRQGQAGCSPDARLQLFRKVSVVRGPDVGEVLALDKVRLAGVGKRCDVGRGGVGEDGHRVQAGLLHQVGSHGRRALGANQLGQVEEVLVGAIGSPGKNRNAHVVLSLNHM